MKRILTLTALFLLSFWACNKQEHELIIRAPIQHTEYESPTCVADTLEVKKRELFTRLHMCSMQVAWANRTYYVPKKKQVQAQTALYPMYEN